MEKVSHVRHLNTAQLEYSSAIVIEYSDMAGYGFAILSASTSLSFDFLLSAMLSTNLVLTSDLLSAMLSTNSTSSLLEFSPPRVA